MIEKLKLHLLTVVLGLLFCLAALAKRGRSTHAWGVAGAGKLKVVDHPEFPEHDFFQAGRVFPVRLRHGTVSFPDDATLDLRGAAIKLADSEYATPLDLVLNSGIGTFMHAWSVWQFSLGIMRGEKGLEEVLNSDLVARRLFTESLRRAPSSYAQIVYSSQIQFYFWAKDGKKRYVRFRLLPGDRGPESGLPDAEDTATPWRQKRRPDCTLPPDYLRQEYRERMARGPVVYNLQLALHDGTDGDDTEVFSQYNNPWDPATSPWLDLATITLDRLLDEAETERVRFNIRNQPPSMGLIPARSIYDPNSVAHLRARIYTWSQRLRYLIYALTGKTAGGKRFSEVRRTRPAAAKAGVTGTGV
jgi:arachidonate 5-lipoxygenase